MVLKNRFSVKTRLIIYIYIYVYLFTNWRHLHCWKNYSFIGRYRRLISIKERRKFYPLSPILINTTCTRNHEIDEKYVLEPKEDERSLLPTPGLRGVPEISEETRWNLFCFSATRRQGWVKKKRSRNKQCGARVYSDRTLSATGKRSN